MASLANQTISSSYDGLIKTSSDNAVPVSGVQALEDGSGNALALSVGRSGNGVTVSGNLAVDTNTLYVDAANNAVGVGTTSVTGTYGKLSVAGGMRILDDSNAKLEIGRYSAAASNSYIKMGANSNSLRFTDHNDQFDLVTIQNDGNVGIGTNSSNQKITIGFADNGTDGISFRSASYASLGKILVQNETSSSNGNMQFYTRSGGDVFERMRIDSSGDIGIGTTDGDIFNRFYARTVGIKTTSGIAKLQIDGSSYSGIDLGQGGTRYSEINCSATNLNIATIANIPIIFGTGTSAAERMRITSGGYLKASSTGSYLNAGGAYHELYNNAGGNQVLQASTEASTNPYGIGIKFTAASPNNTTLWFLRAEDSTNAKFYVYSNGNVVNTNNSYGAISDAKLKENVTDASPKLNDLLQVKIRNFNYIGDDKKQLGVVAQELESVFPSMIDESPDFEEQEVIDEEGNVTKERVDLGTTTKSVKYSVFVPMLIKAMQEQQEIINDLKARIETLEAK